MLPVATPPNAIVFSAAKMNPVEMVNIQYRTLQKLTNLAKLQQQQKKHFLNR